MNLGSPMKKACNHMQLKEQGLQYIYNSRQDFIEDLLDMTAIEAPSFHERQRAEALCKKFEEAGLSDVHIDKTGNAVGIRWGASRSQYILLEAHMDTVFPFGTVTERPKVGGDGIIRCPGVSDNTAGLVNLIYVAKALQYIDLRTEKTLIFAGTVNEESMGDSDGIKGLLEDYAGKIEACITIDGCEYNDIVYKATAIKTKKYTLQGMGGHPYSEYGVIPQVLTLVSEMAVKIGAIPVPGEPKTIVAVTSLRAGDEAVIHAIPDTASFIVNYRSNSKAWMEKLDAEIEHIVKETLSAEREKWMALGENLCLDYSSELLCDMLGGEQADDCEIVKALDEAIREVGGSPYYAKGGCCNSNVPISMGIPAVAIGTSNLERGEHTLEEFTPTEHIYKCTQEIFLMALKMGGTVI